MSIRAIWCCVSTREHGVLTCSTALLWLESASAGTDTLYGTTAAEACGTYLKSRLRNARRLCLRTAIVRVRCCAFSRNFVDLLESDFTVGVRKACMQQLASAFSSVRVRV